MPVIFFNNIYRLFTTSLSEKDKHLMCPKNRLTQASRARRMPTFVSFIFSNHSLKYNSNYLPHCSCCSIICYIIFCEVQSKTKYNCLQEKGGGKYHLTTIYFHLLAKSQESRLRNAFHYSLSKGCLKKNICFNNFKFEESE